MVDVCKIKPSLNFSFRLHFTVAVKNSCCQVFVKDINQDKPSLLGFWYSLRHTPNLFGYTPRYLSEQNLPIFDADLWICRVERERHNNNANWLIWGGDAGFKDYTIFLQLFSYFLCFQIRTRMMKRTKRKRTNARKVSSSTPSSTSAMMSTRWTSLYL